MNARWLLIPLAISLGGCGYNRIQALDEQVDQMRANVETELMRRNDLIPNLVATVDEAAEFQQETFTQVARARAGLAEASEQLAEGVSSGVDPDQLSQLSAEVARSMRLFINVAVEAYPDLTANENFRALQDELTETENRISVSRQDYNEAVQVHNSYIRQFPQVITAKVIGADRREPFEAPPEALEAPTVDFDR
ncbi:MAG TPA: LemA family protein [Longimicrobiales bacterium]|nr:LemA family protein [Longimicrobiales bacterium]